MKNKHNTTSRIKIPLFQCIYCFVLFLLIAFRIIFNNLSLYVNLANYISMVISVLSVFWSVNKKVEKGRKFNIYKSISIFILLIFVFFGSYIIFFGIDIPQLSNDIFTLVALMFCISNSVFECIIVKLFSLQVKAEKKAP